MKVFQISFRIFVVQKAKLYQNKIDKGINIAIFSICPAKMLTALVLHPCEENQLKSTFHSV